MKKYNVTLDIFRMETVYGIEAKNTEEAVKKAIEQSGYNDGATEITLFEIKEDK
jgi:hypothetical protein